MCPNLAQKKRLCNCLVDILSVQTNCPWCQTQESAEIKIATKAGPLANIIFELFTPLQLWHVSGLYNTKTKIRMIRTIIIIRINNDQMKYGATSFCYGIVLARKTFQKLGLKYVFSVFRIGKFLTKVTEQQKHPIFTLLLAFWSRFAKLCVAECSGTKGGCNFGANCSSDWLYQVVRPHRTQHG